jgi:hypothetical protein
MGKPACGRVTVAQRAVDRELEQRTVAGPTLAAEP